MKKFNIDDSIIAEFGKDFTTIISKETKRGAEIWNRSKWVDGYNLHDVYNKPSSEKQHAWYYCKDLCSKYNGTNLHIVSHNVFAFAAAFEIGDKLAYITSATNYLIV